MRAVQSDHEIGRGIAVHLAHDVGVAADARVSGVFKTVAQQNAEIDALVAGVLDDDGRLAETRELAAVPVFGIPGWCAENARESYYDDRSYFRPAPLRRNRRR